VAFGIEGTITSVVGGLGRNTNTILYDGLIGLF
jgi:hypothetical protein